MPACSSTAAACAAVLCATLLLVMPGSAITVAVYGSTAGLNTSLHQDTFSVACSLPGVAGPELDGNLPCFTNATTDVIILGGDAGFSGNTEAALSNATAAGKILVLSGDDLARFADILPVQSAGMAPGSAALVISNPNATLSGDIFAGLPAQYPNTTIVSSRESYVTRPGATTLLSFENGDPALAFLPYGNGYVVTWLAPAEQAYLSGTDADLINERLITRLLALRSGAPAAATTTSIVPATTLPVTNVTTLPATTVTLPAFGNLFVSSSPGAAGVYIDNAYEGITPVNLSGISPGTHAIRLAMNGYADYESTVDVTGGSTVAVSGSLAEHNRTEMTPVATVTPVPTETASFWTSTSVIAALLGSVAAIIGAIATLHSLYHKRS
ncbi:PEGA domain-containing protein [Methanoregula sp.]|uniref:PEGA domain-containing protein n=1 Tax=Methanoregula sp. TaxID=2052170 RepID=UPI002BE106C7|nr:PEGA domain-containing protein [Methanoregula sp.]HVP95602.1 PEGA domain-containing protein [Methanoregula sp.]